MPRPAVQVESLQVHQMPGVERGRGWELEHLSPGFNLIHGPNGCGKTTTARAVQELLWPGQTGLTRPSVAGKLVHDGSATRVEVEAGGASRDGGPPPPTGPASHLWRYRLALDELLRASDGDFARAVWRESQGGYDLAGAAEAAGFTGRRASRKKERQAVVDAERRVDGARREEAAVEHDADRLATLEAQRQEATAASREVELLTAAASHHEASASLAAARAELDAMPPGVARLHGDEREALDRLAEARRTASIEMRDAEDRAQRAQAAAVETGLIDAEPGESGIDDAALGRLKALAGGVGDDEDELARQERELSQTTAEADAAAGRLGAVIGEDLSAMNVVEPRGVWELAERWDRVRARRAVWEERRRSLGGGESVAEGEAELRAVERAHEALSNWLATPAPPMPLPPPDVEESPRRAEWSPLVAWLLMVVLAVVLAAVLIWVQGWWWGLAVLAAITVGAWGMWRGWPRRSEDVVVPPDAPPPDARVIHRQGFESLNVSGPAAWSASAVATRLHELADAAAQRRSAMQRARRLAELDEEARDLEREQAQVDREAAQLRERLGVEVSLGERWLPVLVESLARWHAARDEARGVEAARDRAAEQRAQRLAEVAAAVAHYGIDPPADAAGAGAAVASLEQRQRRLEKAQGEGGAANADAQRARRDLQDADDRRAAVLGRLGLLDDSSEEAEEADARVDDWLNQRERYQNLTKRIDQLEGERGVEARKLRDCPDLLELDGAELAVKLARHRAMAERRDELSEEVARIRRDIERAMGGHSVADAVAARDAATAELAAALREERATRAGSVVAHWLRGRVEERARPEVLVRAQALLVRITGGALRLRIEEGDASPDPPSLAAEVSGRLRALDDLSSGERAQVLLAVRLAFMEEGESARLPLIVDEALANSDDDRADRIIRTVIACAREGRQVFCLTSQGDEADRWLHALRESGVSYREIDLRAVREGAAAASRPVQQPRARPTVPQPGEPDESAGTQGPGPDDRWAYAEVLGVPSLNPAVDSPADVHLWHVVHDVRVLHRLLELGVRTWGELDALLREGGGWAGVQGLDPQRVRAAASALAAAYEAWRAGRGTPIDAAKLLESGCVPASTVDGVRGLLRECKHDGVTLLTALDDGRIRGMWTKTKEAIREYLTDAGHISPDTPLTRDAIRLRVLHAAGDDLAAGRLDPGWLDELLDSLPESETSTSPPPTDANPSH